MAVSSGSNRTVFVTQSVGLSGTSVLVLSHNLGESPWVSYIQTTSLASPAHVVVFGINASQVSLSINDANATVPHILNVVCDRFYTPTQ